MTLSGALADRIVSRGMRRFISTSIGTTLSYPERSAWQPELGTETARRRAAQCDCPPRPAIAPTCRRCRAGSRTRRGGCRSGDWRALQTARPACPTPSATTSTDVRPAAGVRVRRDASVCVHAGTRRVESPLSGKRRGGTFHDASYHHGREVKILKFAVMPLANVLGVGALSAVQNGALRRQRGDIRSQYLLARPRTIGGHGQPHRSDRNQAEDLFRI